MSANFYQCFNNPIEGIYIIIPYNKTVRKLFCSKQVNFICLKRTICRIIKHITHRGQNYIIVLFTVALVFLHKIFNLVRKKFMTKVTGIGGIFIKASDAKVLAA